jgi:hypothetical protein
LVTDAFLLDSDGAEIAQPPTFAAIFYDSEHLTSWDDDTYWCEVRADISSAERISPPGSDYLGWDGVAFDFDATVVPWESSGGACDEMAFAFGITAPEEWMQAWAWGVGAGPMNSDEFEESVSGSVEDYASTWAGNVGIGWLYTNITEEDGFPVWFDLNILFNAPLLSDGEIDYTDGDETGSWLDIGIAGTGDAAVAPDAWLEAVSWYGFSFGS